MKKLHQLAQDALRQIADKQYDTDLKADGITSIIKFGVAFSGKNVAVVKDWYSSVPSLIAQKNEKTNDMF